MDYTEKFTGQSPQKEPEYESKKIQFIAKMGFKDAQMIKNSAGTPELFDKDFPGDFIIYHSGGDEIKLVKVTIEVIE